MFYILTAHSVRRSEQSVIERHANSFHVRCDAQTVGVFDAKASRVSVTVGQEILRDGIEQMWDFLFVLSKREENGTLATRVLLCHPDWDDPLEIAVIESDSEHWNVRLGREEPVRNDRQGVT